MRIRKPSVRSERVVGGRSRLVRLSTDRECQGCEKTINIRCLALRKEVRISRDKIAYRVEFYCEQCTKNN